MPVRFFATRVRPAPRRFLLPPVDVDSEPLRVVRFFVLRLVRPPRFLPAFLVDFPVFSSGLARVVFRFEPLLEGRVSAESASPPITAPVLLA